MSEKRMSPSLRRAWIEMRGLGAEWFLAGGSPSLRRAWIEILLLSNTASAAASPSLRRAWIEMPACPDP